MLACFYNTQLGLYMDLIRNIFRRILNKTPCIFNHVKAQSGKPGQILADYFAPLLENKAF